VPECKSKVGRRRSFARPDRKPESVRALAERLPARAWRTLPCRTTPAGEDVSDRFAFVRVVATRPVGTDSLPPRWEWLIVEWPTGEDAPTDYWLSNLPSDTSRERLARLARLRWTSSSAAQRRARDRPLRSAQLPWLHHHCALVTCAHAFLILERLDPKAPRLA
jgi:hypothetical protein